MPFLLEAICNWIVFLLKRMMILKDSKHYDISATVSWLTWYQVYYPAVCQSYKLWSSTCSPFRRLEALDEKRSATSQLFFSWWWVMGALFSSYFNLRSTNHSHPVLVVNLWILFCSACWHNSFVWFVWAVVFVALFTWCFAEGILRLTFLLHW